MHTNRPRLLSLAATAFLLLAGLTAFGQQQPLSLQDAIARAHTDNPELRAQRAMIDKANADVTESMGVFLPRLSVSETGIYTNSPLNAFGFKLQQEVVTAFDFDPNLLNNPGDQQNYLTQAELQLPLVNIHGWQQRKAAMEGLEAQRNREAFATENITYYVEQVYFGIQLVAESRLVLLQAKTATEAALKYVSDNVEAGYAQRSDELSVQVRLSQIESELLKMDDMEAFYQDQLNRLLGAPRGTLWALTDSLQTVTDPTLPNPEFDLTQRADFQAYQNGLSARNYLYDASRGTALPTLNAFGQYGLYDRKPFGASGQNYMVGVQLKWDLFTGFSRKAAVDRTNAELRGTQAQYDAYEAEKQAEWQQAWRNLNIQQQEIERARLAVSQAREAYRILRDRFQQGLEKTFDLLAAEATLSEQELRLANAQYQHYMAQAKLRMLGTPATTQTPENN